MTTVPFGLDAELSMRAPLTTIKPEKCLRNSAFSNKVSSLQWCQTGPYKLTT